MPLPEVGADPVPADDDAAALLAPPAAGAPPPRALALPPPAVVALALPLALEKGSDPLTGGGPV